MKEPNTSHGTSTPAVLRHVIWQLPPPPQAVEEIHKELERLCERLYTKAPPAPKKNPS